MTAQLALDLPSGLARKRRGMSRNEARDAWFLSCIRTVAKRMSGEKGWVTSDRLRTYASLWRMKPRHPSAWGNVFRGHGWVCVGSEQSAIPGNHGRRIRRWRWEG